MGHPSVQRSNGPEWLDGGASAAAPRTSFGGDDRRRPGAYPRGRDAHSLTLKIKLDAAVERWA